MILVIDNFDSFTYNLVQYLGELKARVKVLRNDAFTLEDLDKLEPEKIVISPGPGRPENAGMSVAVVEKMSGRIPILGVCLGHQVIGEVFGGEVVRADKIMHGKTSLIYHRGTRIFKGVKNPLRAVRYHSLIVKRDSVPKELEITAWTKDGEVMAVKHRDFNLYGVQFHPESIFSEEGMKILSNFLREKM